MPKPRGREHTSLTETAAQVVAVLERLDGVKMIAPGVITSNKRSGSGQRYVTAVFTTAGLELIITGQSTQKVAVHTERAQEIFKTLQASKRLNNFTFKARERRPGI